MCRLPHDKSLLYAPYGFLVVTDQRRVDFKEVVVLIRDKICHNQVEIVAIIQCNPRPGQQIGHGGQIQLQSQCQRHCRGFLRDIVGVASDAGEQLSVQVGALVHRDVVQSPLVDELKEPLLEALSGASDDLLQTLAGKGLKRPGFGGIRGCVRWQMSPCVLILQLSSAGHSASAARKVRFVFPLVEILRSVVVDVLLNAAHQLFRQAEGIAIQNHQRHQHFMGQHKRPDGGVGDAQGLILRKPIHAGGNQREGNAGTAQLVRQIQRVIIAGTQNLTFTVVSVYPDGADGVDDVPGIQSEGIGVGRLTGAQFSNLLPFGEKQLFPGCGVDGAVRAATDDRFRVGCVHDSIGGNLCDVVADNLEGHGGYLVYCDSSLFSSNDTVDGVLKTSFTSELKTKRFSSELLLEIIFKSAHFFQTAIKIRK